MLSSSTGCHCRMSMPSLSSSLSSFVSACSTKKKTGCQKFQPALVDMRKGTNMMMGKRVAGSSQTTKNSVYKQKLLVHNNAYDVCLLDTHSTSIYLFIFELNVFPNSRIQSDFVCISSVVPPHSSCDWVSSCHQPACVCACFVRCWCSNRAHHNFLLLLLFRSQILNCNMRIFIYDFARDLLFEKTYTHRTHI